MTQDPWDAPEQPSYRWNSPPAPYAGQAAPTLAWRVRHSAWLLAPLLGCGVLSCVGFVYCAARTRRVRWIVLAIVSVAATVLGWYLASTWTLPNGDLTTGATAYIIGLWMASLVMAAFAAPDYLDWRAEQGPR